MLAGILKDIVELDPDVELLGAVSLSDALERVLGLNPALADSDADGFSDGLEYHSGSGPLDPNDNPLLKLDNFICAPHMAGVTQEAVERMAIVTVQNMLSVLDGKTNRENVVNKEVLG